MRGVALLAMAAHLASASFGPSFIREPPAVVLFSNDTGGVLDCAARGEPPPDIDWVDERGHVLAIMPSAAR